MKLSFWNKLSLSKQYTNLVSVIYILFWNEALFSKLYLLSMSLLTELSVDLVVYHFQELEGLRLDLWRSRESIAWTSRTFIYFVLACDVRFYAYIMVGFYLEIFYFILWAVCVPFSIYFWKLVMAGFTIYACDLSLVWVLIYLFLGYRHIYSLWFWVRV